MSFMFCTVIGGIVHLLLKKIMMMMMMGVSELTAGSRHRLELGLQLEVRLGTA